MQSPMLAALAALVAYLPARAQAPASGPAAIDGIVQVADRAFRMSIPSGDARMFAAVHLAAGSARRRPWSSGPGT